MEKFNSPTLTEQFVPYSLSKKLEQLGFNEPCIATIDQTEYIHIKGTKQPIRGAMMYDTILAPLWQQAFDFFRIKFRMNPTIISYWQQDEEWKDFSYHYQFQMLDEYGRGTYEVWEGKAERNYEKARLKCLEKLIELVEENGN